MLTVSPGSMPPVMGPLSLTRKVIAGTMMNDGLMLLVVIVTWLLARFGSGGFTAPTAALETKGPTPDGVVTTTTTEAWAPLRMGPSEQVTMPPDSEQIPWEAPMPRTTTPGGRVFVTPTPLALFGPRLFTVRV